MLVFERWETPPIKITMVQLTEQNIEEVAQWVGAGSMHIQHDLQRNTKRVKFRTASDEKHRDGEYILRVYVGDFVALEEAHVDRYGNDIPKQFHDVKRSDIHKFMPVAPAAPYDR